MNVALIMTSIIKLLLVVVAIVGFLGMVIGIPLGVILLVVKKNKEDKRWILWLVIGGPVLLVGAFVTWAVLALVNTFFGINILSVSGV